MIYRRHGTLSWPVFCVLPACQSRLYRHYCHDHAKYQEKKADRKAGLKERRVSQQAGLRSEKAEYFFYEAQWYRDQGKHDKAVQLIRRAIKLDPKNITQAHAHA